MSEEESEPLVPERGLVGEIAISDAVDEDEIARVKAGLGWKNVAWLMLSDVVGTSVLTLAGVAAEVGWLWTIVLIVGLFPAALFTSVLMSRARAYIVLDAHATGRSPPPLGSMGAVAKVLFGTRVSRFVLTAVYGYTMLGNASYLLVIGSALQLVMYDSGWCLPVATAIGAICLFPILISLRALKESVMLCLINTLLILAAIVISLGSMASYGRPSCVETHWVTPGLTLMRLLAAATNVVYAYCGQWMYYEIMDEMSEPAQFPRAFAISGPIMVVVYLLVSCVGYYYGGTHAAHDILDTMQRGPLSRFAAVLLTMHVIVVYVIKSVVLTRFFHRQWRPKDCEARDRSSYMRHGLIGGLILIFGFVVANTIPSFHLLLGLIGGFLGGPINFLFPIAFYLAATNLGSGGGGWRQSIHFIMRERRAEAVAMVIIAFFILMTMVIGTTTVVTEIVESAATQGPAFACHTLAPAPSLSCGMGGNQSAMDGDDGR